MSVLIYKKQRTATEEITCPYCDEEILDSIDIKDNLGIIRCNTCGNLFYWERQLMIIYNSRRDCELNDKKHSFIKRRNINSKNFSYYVCKNCTNIKMEGKQNA